MNSFNFLKQRRFGPFFGVQFLGAFNDNVFKIATVLLLTSQSSSESDAGLVSSVASGMLILPFFLFSPLAGQLCEKYPKALVIQIIKFLEIGIMIFGSFAYFQNNSYFLFLTLFLLGTHSAFFGPAKFSILPQVMEDHELVGANALVELGTFLAIISGTIIGGWFAQLGHWYLATAVFSFAVLGFICAMSMTKVPSTSPNLKIQWNPVLESIPLWKLIRKNSTIFLSVVGVSWFWFLGASIMLQLPSFSKFVLLGDESTATFLLAAFCIAVGVGSILCEKLSGPEIELGLVPIGAFGISLCFIDLSFIQINIPSGQSYSYWQLLTLSNSGFFRVILDLCGMGFFGAFFIIPLNALLQYRSEPSECSRVFAANNIMNAVFMTAASILGGFLYNAGLSSQNIFLVLGIANFVASLYIFLLIPEFTMRFVLWCIASTLYRLRYKNRDLIPKHGPAIIVSNHVSYIDWFIVASACRRPVRFVVYYKFFDAPFLTWFFKLGKAIPIAGAKEDENVKRQAFEHIHRELEDGSVICIFPEGTLTKTGEIHPFRPGVEEIQKDFPNAPVVAMFLKGLWRSYFSRSGGKALAKIPKPKWRIIEVEISKVYTEFVSAEELQKHYEQHLNEAEPNL